MAMTLVLSPLYPILDASYLPNSTGAAPSGDPSENEDARKRYLADCAVALAEAGVTMLQYRNKRDSDEQVLRDAIWLSAHAPASLRIVLNDRVHLVQTSGCSGVHIGQSDLSVSEARALLGPASLVGLSTHNEAQLRAGMQTEADYLAIGPVYTTSSKQDAESAVGLEGVARARAISTKPLVAIGGIKLADAAAVRLAGADSLAVISALFGRPQASAQAPASLAKLAEDFMQVFR